MVIGAFTTLFQQKLIFGLQWIFAERRGEKAEFFVPGGPSESGNARQRQFRVPPMILRVFASKSSQIELRQPERGEGVLILCACRQPQQRICTLMFEHACGKRSVPLVWLISAMGLFRATFPTDFGPKIRKKYDLSLIHI